MTRREHDLGWHPDPDDPTRERYWNGAEWTQHRAARVAAPSTAAESSGNRRVPVIGIAVVAALAVAGIGIAVLLAGESTPATEEDDEAERAEVSVTTCEPPGDAAAQTVRGIVDNGSSGRSDYRIDVAVYASDGTRIGTGSTDALGVESGASAVWVAETDAVADDWDDGATCEITDVERTASR